MPKPKQDQIHIDKLVELPELQMRQTLDEGHVEDLMRALQAGAKLPRVHIRVVDEKNIVTDGHHTKEAHKRLDKKLIPCIVQPGTMEEAVLDAAAANKHERAGLKRTQADKKTATIAAIRATKGEWTMRRLAAWVGVSDHFVADCVPLVPEVKRPEKVVASDGTLRAVSTKGVTRPPPRLVPRSPHARKDDRFDYDEYEKHLGKVIRGVDECAKAFDSKGNEFHSCIRLLNDFVKMWTKWQKRLLQEEKGK